MRQAGVAPEAVARAARADGLDDVALIRLLRTVCGLSFADAKRVSGAAAALDQKQELREGATVYWEGADTVDGSYIMRATIARLDGDRIHLTDHHKYLIRSGELVEVPVSGGMESIPVTYFDKTLAERLGESIQFWDDLARSFSRAG